MRKSWQGQTAQMARMGVEYPQGMEPPEPRRNRRDAPPPHVPLAYVRHAPVEGTATGTMCRPGAEWLGAADRIVGAPYGRKKTPEPGPITCNGCQRALWRAQQKPQKRAA